MKSRTWPSPRAGSEVGSVGLEPVGELTGTAEGDEVAAVHLGGYEASRCRATRRWRDIAWSLSASRVFETYAAADRHRRRRP